MAESPEKLDQVFDSSLLLAERRMGRQLRSYFRQLSQSMTKSWEEQGDIGAISTIYLSSTVLEQLLEDNYILSGQQGSDLAARMLDIEDPQEEGITSETLLALLLVWASERKIIVSNQLIKTSVDIFNELVQTNQENGLVGPDLIKDTMKEFSKRNRNRVETIATTESGEAISEGQETTAELVNIEIRKSWRSQRDSIVRDTHAMADSRYSQEPIPLRQMFQVGSGVGMYPRHHILPIAERVNCRCYTLMTRVEI